MSVSVIIYVTNVNYLDKTIDSLLDNTPLDLIKDIIVCNDGNMTYSRDNVVVINSDNIGRAKAWNQVVEIASGNVLLFIKGITKFKSDWLQPILKLLESDRSALVSPVVHLLDTSFWSSESNRWRRFGWRWDLNLHDRPSVSCSNSPAISSYCIAVNRDWFIELGGFDNGMGIGSGEDLELSIRNWLFGGSVHVVDDSVISCALEIDVSDNTKNNLSRIAETWLQKYSQLFYNMRNIKPSEVDTGRLNNLLKLRDKQKKSIEWYLSTHLPELYGIYSLRGSASKKRIAVVGPGASLDYIQNAYINSFDMIIGTDYVGLLFDCDYIVTDSMAVITELRAKYKPSKFVLPILIRNNLSGEYISSSDIMADSYQFEYAINNMVLDNIYPPFCDYGNVLLTAIHFALFLEPSEIYLFGCDTKLIGDKSHTAKIEYYSDGKVLIDSDSTKRNMTYYEYGLDQLGKLGHKFGVPIIRVNHV